MTEKSITSTVPPTDSSGGRLYYRLRRSGFWDGGRGRLLPVQRPEKGVVRVLLWCRAAGHALEDKLWACGRQEFLRGLLTGRTPNRCQTLLCRPPETSTTFTSLAMPSVPSEWLLLCPKHFKLQQHNSPKPQYDTSLMIILILILLIAITRKMKSWRFCLFVCYKNEMCTILYPGQNVHRMCYTIALNK